jgi:hypothetical protein
MTATFAMRPTGSLDRGGEFLCLVAAVSARALGVRDGGLAVLGREVPDLGELTAIAGIRVDDAVDPATAAVDQTLRKALGVGDDGLDATVTISPLWRPRRARAADVVAKALGEQYLHLRVRKAEIIDAEKRICRVPADVFALVGCKQGDLVVCEGVSRDTTGRWMMVRTRLRALEGTVAPAAAAPPTAAPLLGNKGDLRWIRLDKQAREEVNAVVELSSVRVRRDLRRRVVDGMRDAGIAFFLSSLTLVNLTGVHGVARGVLAATLFVLAVYYVLWKIRAELP